jgi:bifunctional DNA-binding transcriptional regulator/antitoxin component of YhaV-PrlF toxin-antitoxin module
MKLQKHLTKKGTEYFKWEIIVPDEIVRRAELKEGDELEAEARKGEIRLKNRANVKVG